MTVIDGAAIRRNTKGYIYIIQSIVYQSGVSIVPMINYEEEHIRPRLRLGATARFEADVWHRVELTRIF